MTQPPPDQPYGSDPAYSGPGYSDQQGPSRPKGMAISALVLGVLALLLCWTVVGGILLGLLAIVLGLIAAGRAKRGEAGGRGMAITGVVLGLLGMVLAGVLIAAGASLLNSDSGKDLRNCLEEAGDDQARVEQCQRDFQDQLEDQLG